MQGHIIKVVDVDNRNSNLQGPPKKYTDGLLRCLLKGLRVARLIHLLSSPVVDSCQLSSTMSCECIWAEFPPSAICSIRVIPGQKANIPLMLIIDYEVSRSPTTILPNLWLTSKEKLRRREAGLQMSISCTVQVHSCPTLSPLTLSLPAGKQLQSLQNISYTRLRGTNYSSCGCH